MHVCVCVCMCAWVCASVCDIGMYNKSLYESCIYYFYMNDIYITLHIHVCVWGGGGAYPMRTRHGKLVAVSAPLVMPTRDADIAKNDPLPFRNKQPFSPLCTSVQHSAPLVMHVSSSSYHMLTLTNNLSPLCT